MSSLVIASLVLICFGSICFNSSFVFAIPLLAFSYAMPAEHEAMWGRYILFCSALLLPLSVGYFIKGAVPNFPKAALSLVHVSIIALIFEHDSFYSLISQLLSADAVSLEVVSRFLGQALSTSALIAAAAVLMVGLVQLVIALFNKDRSISWSPALQSLTPILVIFILGLSLRFIDSLIMESHHLF
jgi:hypothetical protein